MADEVVERFRPTSGRVVGAIGLLLVVGLVAAGVADPAAFPAPVVAGALVVGVLIWAAMLRPGLALTRSALVMRNMLDTVEIPLAGIEEVAVRQVVAVRSGDRRYVSPAVGRSVRQVFRARSRGGSGDAAVPATYADYVEDRIRSAAADAARAAGVRPRSQEQVALGRDVRRTPAWVEIALLAASVAGFVVTLAV